MSDKFSISLYCPACNDIDCHHYTECPECDELECDCIKQEPNDQPQLKEEDNEIR